MERYRTHEAVSNRRSGSTWKTARHDSLFIPPRERSIGHRKAVRANLSEPDDRHEAVSSPVQTFRGKRQEGMRRDRKQGRRLAQQDEGRSPALAPSAFGGFERQPPPFALQFLHCPASGVADDRLWRKSNAIALPPRPFTPILVLRDAVYKVADRVEHRAPHKH